MALKQVYYTSSAIGLRGGSGFQINAASPSIDNTMLDQIERYSGYQPPTHLAYNPAATRPDFPTALAYYRIANGGCVVARSVYLGATTGGGRGGNFFTHALVSLTGPAELAGALPIQFWNGGFWADTAAPTTELPDLPLPAPSPDMRLADAVAFVHARPERIELVEPMLTAALDGASNRRRIVLVASPAECAAWIAVLTLALPRAIAYEMSFTTYIRDVNQLDHLISGVDGDDHSNWSSQQLQFDLYVFDPERGIQSPVAATSSFARWAAESYRAHHSEQLALFRQFCDSLKQQPTVETLDDLLLLHQIGAGAEVSCEDVLRATRIACRLLAEAPSMLRPVLERLGQLDAQAPEVNSVVQALFAAARRSTTESAAEVVRWFSTWLGNQWLPNAGTATIARMGETLRDGQLPDAECQSLCPALARELRRGDNIARTTALLQFAEALRVGAQLGISRREALEQVAAEDGGSPAVQALFRHAIARGDRDAGEVLFQALAATVHDPQGLAAWDALLADERILADLDRRAREQQFLPLFLALPTIQLPAGVSRAQALRRTLEQIQVHFGDYFARNGTQDLMHLIETVSVARLFPEPAVPLGECDEVLRYVPAEWIVATSLHAKMMQGLLVAPRLGDPAFDKLMDRVIANDDLRHARAFALTSEANLGSLLRTIRVDWWPALNTGAFETLTSFVVDLLRTIPAVYIDARVQVLGLTLRRALRKPPEAKLLRALLKAAAPWDTELWSVLEARIAGAAKQQPGSDWFATVFETLALARRRNGSSGIAALDDAFVQVWETLSKEDRRIVDQRLKALPDTAAVWQAWQHQHGWWATLKGRLPWTTRSTKEHEGWKN